MIQIPLTPEAYAATAKILQEKQGIAFMRGAMFEREKNFDAAEQQFRKVLAVRSDNPATGLSSLSSYGLGLVATISAWVRPRAARRTGTSAIRSASW